MIALQNKNATKEAKALLAYLESIRGKGMLVGQHTQTMEQRELWHIEKMTGKLPALIGFELLAYSPNINYETCNEACLKEVYENRDTLEKAYEWAEKGAILTFTWHWYSPIGGRDKAFYTENTDFDARKVLEEGTEERKAFYADMDVMAELLQGFKDKNIPILWRPFHELEGTWFWWGAQGMDVGRKLFREMYTYYTEVKHLDNLIWVWNNPAPEGYVGDEYCDIVSGDFYPPAHNHTSYKERFETISSMTDTKMLALGELGVIPDIDAVVEDKLDWLWFMMWSNEFVMTEDYTYAEEFKKQYNHEYAITLDKLPKIY